jgi:hypothetical protein
MSKEDAADNDSRKQYALYSDVKDVEFVRQDDGNGIAVVYFKDGSNRELYCYGNVYVMNDAGKTISAFGAGHPIPYTSDCPVLTL